MIIKGPDINVTFAAGILFAYPSEEYKEKAREGVAKSLPFPFNMPCGVLVEYHSLSEIPTEDTPCPCGDPTHWLVKYKVDSRLDKRLP